LSWAGSIVTQEASAGAWGLYHVRRSGTDVRFWCLSVSDRIVGARLSQSGSESLERDLSSGDGGVVRVVYWLGEKWRPVEPTAGNNCP